jgi:hypothetical protein
MSNQLNGICVRGQKQNSDFKKQMTDLDERGQWHRVQWLPETQHFVNEALQYKRLKNKMVFL